MTPTLPTMAKGEARIRVAWLAIMYPPEAAMRSTHTVTSQPALRSRASCAAAKAKEVTSPPGDCSIRTISGFGPKSRLRGVLEPTRKVTTSAKRKKSGSETCIVEKSMTTTTFEVSGVVFGLAPNSLWRAPAEPTGSFVSPSAFAAPVVLFVLERPAFFFFSCRPGGPGPIASTVFPHCRFETFMLCGTRCTTLFQIASSRTNLSLRHSHMKCCTGCFDSSSNASLLAIHFTNKTREVSVKRFTTAATSMAWPWEGLFRVGGIPIGWVICCIGLPYPGGADR
mmetsp:Transcript_7846/g.18927  ORF Transcript_7846/g.18927 Transcript_7846/m.18927 type:complete len:282 (-) Transcript_7846:89-934(-)